MKPRVWSAWQIMNHFRAHVLVGLVGLLENVVSGLSVTKYFVASGAPPLDVDIRRAQGLFQIARGECNEIGLSKSVGQLDLALPEIADCPDMTAGELVTQIERIKKTIVKELEERKFLYVPADQSKLLDNESLFGEGAYLAFESARSDIREAGNCLATDCNTACVFHLMRAVEWGLRALAADLNVLAVPRKNITIPIESAEWQQILSQLHPAAVQKVEALPPGAQKQETQEFYFPLLQDIQGFKEAFRNHVMHTRKTYNQNTAKDVFDYVKRFMVLL